MLMTGPFSVKPVTFHDFSVKPTKHLQGLADAMLQHDRCMMSLEACIEVNSSPLDLLQRHGTLLKGVSKTRDTKINFLFEDTPGEGFMAM